MKAKFKKFFSQFGEDEWIYNNLELPEKGFYVDVGAGDPIKNSNTYFLEKNGWEGLCIDVDERQTKKIKAKRNCQVFTGAIMNYDGSVLMDFHRYPELNRVSENGEKEVICYRLRTILNIEKITKIDLLSIDVEGQEMEVLKSMEPVQFPNLPKIIIIEHHSDVDGERGEEIKEFFKLTDYKLVLENKNNYIFAIKGAVKY